MSETVRLAGWKVRWGIEKIRPYWSFLPAELTHRIMACYDKRANPDEVSLTRDEFVRMAKENHDTIVGAAWDELRKQLA